MRKNSMMPQNIPGHLYLWCMLAAIKNINLAVRFFLELYMFGSFAYWGFSIPGGVFLHLLIGIGLPLVVALVWGIFLSPKAKVKLPIALRLFMELALFLTAAWLLYTIGQAVPAMVLAIAFVINRTMLLLLKA